MEVVRFDYSLGPLAAPMLRPDGSVIYDARIARSGPHEYPGGVIERRDEVEIHNIATQLQGAPVTVFHPRVLISLGGEARVVGKTVSARVDGDHVAAKLHLDPTGVAMVKAGLKEISLGYATQLKNGFQKNIRVDHVALVSAGRCGPSCSVRADCNGDCGQDYSLSLQVTNQLGVLRLGG